jgi:hypothetical protein
MNGTGASAKYYFYDGCTGDDLASCASKKYSTAELTSMPSNSVTFTPGTGHLETGVKTPLPEGDYHDLVSTTWTYTYDAAYDRDLSDNWSTPTGDYTVAFDNISTVKFDYNPPGAPPTIILDWYLEGLRSDGRKVAMYFYDSMPYYGEYDIYNHVLNSAIYCTKPYKALFKESYYAWANYHATFATPTYTYGIMFAKKNCVDADNDTYGIACAAGPDCDDDNASIYPGATEVCNSKDDDCDSVIDEGCGDNITYYRDFDNDTYGDAAVTLQGSSYSTPAGYVTDNTDCDDTRTAVNPGATEVCNGLDDNCDNRTDEGFGNPKTYYLDADNDTYGDAAAALPASDCVTPAGYVTDNTDCDDKQTLYADGDGDTYGAGARAACGVVSSTDCNDAVAAINPGAVENCTNGIDDNCDGATDGCAPGECGYWRGKWKFTFKDATSGAFSTDNVTITDICVNEDGPYTEDGKPACMDNKFFNCQARGTRASNDQQITMGQAYMDKRIYAYYETWTPGGDTEYDAIHYSDFVDVAAYIKDPFGYTGGYTPMIPGIINNCDFVTAIDGSFTIYSAAKPDGISYENAFGLVSGERLGVDPATCVTPDKCIDKDNDTYGDNCSAGPDCNDNDSSVHDNCNDNATCVLKIVPKRIFKLLAFLKPFMPFVISADKGSDIEFVRPIDIDWGTDAINDILRIRIGKRIIAGFLILRPLKLESDNYTVVVTYGDNGTDNGTEECGKIEVK